MGKLQNTQEYKVDHAFDEKNQVSVENSLNVSGADSLKSNIDFLFIDVDRNPIKGLQVELSWADKTFSTVTPANGWIQGVDIGKSGVEVTVKVKRHAGGMKEILKTNSGIVERLVTIQSKKLKLKAKTVPHPDKASDTPEHKSTPQPNTSEKKSEGILQSALNWASELLGIKSKDITGADGRPVARVSGDQPKIDFLATWKNDPITESDLLEAAKELNCEVEVIKSIRQQESKRAAFDSLHRPTILYERHYFSRLTKHKYDKDYHDISGKAYKSGSAKKGKVAYDDGEHYGRSDWQYGRLVKAYSLDKDAALQSASWGAFQIMGANYKICGYATVKDFVLDMSKSEKYHLKALVGYAKGTDLDKGALKNKDWAKIASAYNGPGYKKNNYDKELEKHYNAFVKKALDDAKNKEKGAKK